MNIKRNRYFEFIADIVGPENREYKVYGYEPNYFIPINFKFDSNIDLIEVYSSKSKKREVIHLYRTTFYGACTYPLTIPLKTICYLKINEQVIAIAELSYSQLVYPKFEPIDPQPFRLNLLLNQIASEDLKLFLENVLPKFLGLSLLEVRDQVFEYVFNTPSSAFETVDDYKHLINKLKNN